MTKLVQNNVPELRFNEFTKPWQEKKLGEVFEHRSEKGFNDFELLSVTTKNGVKKRTELEGKDNSSSDKSNYKLVNINDIVYNSMRMWQGASGVSNYLGIVSPAYTVLKGNQKNSSVFFGYYFKTLKMIHTFQRNSQGLTSDTWNLKYPQLSTIKMFIPNLEEQQKIAEFLGTVDERVSDFKQKKELLTQYKKGLMQKIFNKEIRFKDNHGKPFPNWQEKKLGEVADIKTGNKDTKNKIKNGLYPFFVRSNTIEKINSYSYDGEAILTSGDGVGVGKNYHYINGKFDFHQRVYCIYNFHGIYGKFFYQYFKISFYKRVIRLSAKNSVDSVRRSMVFDMLVPIPHIDEQKKIADFLSAVDDKINNVTKQLTKAEEFKKGLLQKMFV